MAYAEYAFRAYRKYMGIREKEMNSQWFYRLSSQTASPPTLEEEIYKLRSEMEALAGQEASLTAPNVVEISSRLDKKINEYMRAAKSQCR